jgi:hypothetical protein
MKVKLIVILLAAAGFGWGFSALVQHADQTIKPENAKVACNSWSGDGCARPIDR